jgi:hypothetical protein
MDQPVPAPRADEFDLERPPEEDRVRVGSGPRARGAHLEEDPYIGVRVNHTLKPTGPLPPEEASLAGEDMASGMMNRIERVADAAPPIQDVRITPEEPSVWEAIEGPKE